MTPKQKENKKYPTKGNKEYYKFSQCLALIFKPLMMAERKEKQKQYWRQTMAIVIDAPRVKNCGDCIGYLRCKGWTDEPYSCPIVGEIPDKHGDLKDIADIMQRYEHEIVNLKAELPKEQYEQIFRVFHVFIKPWIDQAPTILESTK